MKNIPVHKLQERASFGLEMGHTSLPGAREALEGFEIHRDDCYSFLLIETGEGSMDVDFVNVHLPGSHVYYLLPGQIHHNIKTNQSNTWYISVNTSLVPKNYREVFESNLLLQQPHPLNPDLFKQFQNLINVLNDQFNGDSESSFYKQLVHSLLDSLLCMYAKVYQRPDIPGKKTSRLFQITQQFKNLLIEKIRQEKSPSFYASQLNISEIYLNEAVKEITGFNVTYWLMNEIMLEAKRLLIYSQFNVKEIAYQLGYEDHTYFSKLFKKQCQSSPRDFRHSYIG
jgi:AraC family transcriptional activator of pobA